MPRRAQAATPLRPNDTTPPRRSLPSHYVVDMRGTRDVPPLSLWELTVEVAYTPAGGPTYHRPSSRRVIARTAGLAIQHVAAQLPPKSRVRLAKAHGTIRPTKPYRAEIATGTRDYVLKSGADAKALSAALKKVRARRASEVRRTMPAETPAKTTLP